MSARTELTALPRKSRLLTTMCVGAVALITSLSANAAFVFSGGSTQGLPVPGNDFDTELQGLGFSEMTTGTQLSVDQDGTVTFYYIAAESAYTNSFNSGSSNTIAENNHSFDWDGWDSFTISVAAGDDLNFSFTSDGASAMTPVNNPASTNLEGLGIMTPGDGSSSLMQLVLAYNDNALYTGDSDFDDMLVRADFRVAAVPVPAAVWLFGSGLLGLIGMARRRKQ